MTTRRLWALGLLAVLTLPAVTTRIYASDEVQYFAFVRSLAFDRDLSFENEYQYFFEHDAGGEGFHATFLEDRYTQAGRRINFGTIGPALLWAPFYAVGHIVAGVTGAPQDGYSQPYITAVAYGSAVYGWLAIFLSAAIAHRWMARGRGAALAVMIGTPLLFYVYVAPPFSHACATFAVTLSLWVWLRVRETWSPAGIILLGLTVGLMATMRDQAGLFAIGPALDFARWAWRRRQWRPTAIRAAVGAAAALAAFLPQLLASRAINGYIGPHESVGNKMSWMSPHAFSVLLNPEHGWFVWTPLAVLGLAGLVGLALGRIRADPRPELSHDARWFGVCALVMIGLQVYINGAVESWTVAGAFGQRRFLEVTPLLVVGLAAVLSSGRQPRRILWGIVVLSVWWNLGLLIQFGTHRMDRQRLTLRDNAWQTFVVLPRDAPALAWQYLTDRSSFYRQPRQ
ncbi:MAG: hypothetical protein HQ485_06920 [Acidobacteria bacterium]|nr:hypothetical protein [Acidobacteriota bacterium]